MLRFARGVGAAVSAACPIALAYLGFNVPTEPKALLGFHSLIIGLCAIGISAVVLWVVFDYIESRDLPDRLVTAMQRAGYRLEPQRNAEDTLEEPSDEATEVVGAADTRQADQKVLSFADLAIPVPEELSNPGKCLSIIRANVANTASFKEQVLRFDYAVRECIKSYHGNLDVDSFVAPGIVHAMGQRPFEIQDRLEMFLKRDVRRHDSQLPITVRRLVMLTEDFDKAAADLADNIPPL